jgi:hypothetical protein
MAENNHYIPIFYQKRWVGSDGQNVWVYSRNPARVEASRRHPSGLGYAKDLYTVPGVDLTAATYLEREFFNITDDLAAKSLTSIESGLLIMDRVTRSGWTRFIVFVIT